MKLSKETASAKGSLKDLKGCVPVPEKPISIEEMKAAVLEEAGEHMKPSVTF